MRVVGGRRRVGAAGSRNDRDVSGRFRAKVNAMLLIVVAVGGGFLYLSPPERHGTPDTAAGPRDIEAPPAPRLEPASDGTIVARIDMDRLTTWCRSIGLPDPPHLSATEPAVGEALIEALYNAATNRSPETLGTVGRIFESLEALGAAEAYFALAASGQPRDFRWRYFLGCLRQKSGRRDQAIADLTHALTLNRDYALTHARLAQMLMEANRLDAAEQHLKRYISMRGDDWLGYVGLGRLALRRGQPDVALAHLQRAVELGPDDFQVHYFLGRAHAARGERSLATKHFAIASRLPKGAWFRDRDPLLLESDRLAGGATRLAREFERLQNSNDWKRLAALAERIVARRGGDTTMMGNLASLYRKLKRFDAAQRILDRALALQPDAPRLLGLRAEVFFSKGDYERAVSVARRAVERDPENGLAYNVLGRALYMASHPTEAVAAMRRAVALDPDNAGKIFVLGEMLLANDHVAAATQCYERTLELDPNHDLARRKLAAIDQARHE